MKNKDYDVILEFKRKRKKMIEELLDQYSVDEFDDLLIAVIKRMQERKEIDKEIEEEENDNNE
tara:strand:- start:41 stop:229 length:189 start_codon:yes stop_codon:yes gene_type:complete